jgi:hypothetical protein
MESVRGGLGDRVQKYSVLLIITDGAINDPDETVDTIVELSYFPASVIIVGVGDADFSASKSIFTI